MTRKTNTTIGTKNGSGQREMAEMDEERGRSIHSPLAAISGPTGCEAGLAYSGGPCCLRPKFLLNQSSRAGS